MLYNIVKIVLIIIVLMLSLHFYRKSILDSNLVKRVLIILLTFIVLLVINCVPFNKIFVSFSNYTEAFNYDVADARLILENIGNDYAFVVYSNNNDGRIRHYFKKNNRWYIQNIFNQSQNKSIVRYDYYIFANLLEKKNIGMVCVSYESIKKIDISDSLNSKFTDQKFINGNNEMIAKCSPVIELNKDYYIIVNSDKYNIWR